MNLKEKAVKGVFWSALQKWGEQAISFTVFLVLARLLGPHVFGLVATASVFLAFVQVFLDQGFAEAVVQRGELEPEHLNTAFWVGLGTSALLTIIGIGCADVAANALQQPQLAPIIRWLSLSFILRGLNSVQAAILRRKFDFKSLAVRSLIGTIIGGVTGVTMALMGYGVWSLVGQQLSNLIVGVPLLWWISGWRPGFQVSRKHFKDLFSFGINVVAFDLLNFFNKRSDNLLVALYLGPLQLGYYNVAYRLLEIMIQLLTNITNQVAVPAFAKLQHEPERVKNAFYKATQLTSLISFPAFLSVAVLSPELVRLLFGEKWLPSIPVMQVLSIMGVLQSIFFFNSTVLLAMGKPNWRLWINCLNAITNFAAFALVVKWGILAVASAFTVRGYLFSPIPILAIQKLIRIKLKDYLSQFVAPLAGSLAMVTVLFGIRHVFSGSVNLYSLMIIYILSGAIAYIATLQLIAPKLVRSTLDLVLLALPKSKLKKT